MLFLLKWYKNLGGLNVRKTLELMDAVFADVWAGLKDTQNKLDAMPITLAMPEYISTLEENRRLCNEHREAMKCNILV